MGRRAWQAIVQKVTELNMTEQLSKHTHVNKKTQMVGWFYLLLRCLVTESCLTLQPHGP